jgi:hypothetical protein
MVDSLVRWVAMGTIAASMIAACASSTPWQYASMGSDGGVSDATSSTSSSSGSPVGSSSGSTAADSSIAGDGSTPAPESGAGGGGASDSGSMDEPPPHMVGQCNQLAAVGQWENITPPGVVLDQGYTGVLMTLADPVNTGTVYATTYQNGVYKSTDCGATWVKTNTGQNGTQLDSGRIWSAVIDPIDPTVLYALTGYGADGLWKTTNSGVDWNQVLPLSSLPGVPGFLARISMDPTNHQHLVINFHDNCSGSHAPVCFGETKDGGMTWNVIDVPASLVSGWAEGTGVIVADSKTWLYSNGGLYLTKDGGNSWHQVSNQANVDTAQFQVPGGSYYVGSASGVLSSTDLSNWTLIPNSGGLVQQVIGDGVNLYAVEGFYAPNDGMTLMWSASYQNPSQWSVLSTPGLQMPLTAGANGMDYDADHHVLYVALQGDGMWRFVTH